MTVRARQAATTRDLRPKRWPSADRRCGCHAYRGQRHAGFASRQLSESAGRGRQSWPRPLQNPHRALLIRQRHSDTLRFGRRCPSTSKWLRHGGLQQHGGDSQRQSNSTDRLRRERRRVRRNTATTTLTISTPTGLRGDAGGPYRIVAGGTSVSWTEAARIPWTRSPGAGVSLGLESNERLISGDVVGMSPQCPIGRRSRDSFCVGRDRGTFSELYEVSTVVYRERGLYHGDCGPNQSAAGRSRGTIWTPQGAGRCT